MTVFTVMTAQEIENINDHAFHRENRRLLEEDPKRFNGKKLPFFCEDADYVNLARLTRESAVDAARFLADLTRTTEMVLVRLTVADNLFASCFQRPTTDGRNITFRGDGGRVFNLYSQVELEHVHFD